MVLTRREGKLAGKLRFGGTGWFGLRGTISDQGEIVLNQSDEDGAVFNVWKGRFTTPATIEGKWSPVGGTEEIPFSVRETAQLETSRSNGPTDEEIAGIAKEEGLQGKDIEAYIQAYKFIRRFVVSCGDSDYYTEAAAKQYGEVKGFTISLESRQITEPDQLNGVQWKGISKYASRLYRYSNPQQGGWYDWQQGTPQNLSSDVIQIDQRNGKWSVNPGYFVHRPLKCQEIPK
jgi:hypothetical protein